MLKYATDRQMPMKIVMFDSNSNLNNILFKKELDDSTDMNKNLQIIYTVSQDNDNGQQLPATNDSKGEYGRISKAMILKYLDKTLLNNSIFYICCLPSMSTPCNHYYRKN
jgi:glycine betaine catabolism B